MTIFSFLLVVFLLMDVSGKNLIKQYHKYILRKNDHEKEYRIRSEVFHHGLKPNVRFEKSSWGGSFYPIAINSLGFKDADCGSIPAASTQHRILFIGDSFTEGVGIPYPDTFVGIIDKVYRQNGIEVLNAAATSYSPSIYYAKVKHLVTVLDIHFDELVVFIDISDIYDDAVHYRLIEDRVVDNEAQIREKERRQTELFNRVKKANTPVYYRVEEKLKRDSLAVYGAVRLIHGLFFPRIIDHDYDSINLRGSMWTIEPGLMAAYGETGILNAQEAMDRLHHMCSREGIKLTIAVYPAPDQIRYNDIDSVQVKIWSTWAKQRGVNIIDYFPEFIPVPHTLENVRGILDTYFISGDVHWNRKGHRKVADHFLKTFKPAQKNS